MTLNRQPYSMGMSAPSVTTLIRSASSPRRTRRDPRRGSGSEFGVPNGLRPLFYPGIPRVDTRHRCVSGSHSGAA